MNAARRYNRGALYCRGYGVVMPGGMHTSRARGASPYVVRVSGD